MPSNTKNTAEESIPDSFRPLLESLAVPILITDEEGLIRNLNPRAETLFRCRSVEVAGQPVQTLLPDAPGVPGAKSAEDNGLPQPVPARRLDGTRFSAKVFANLIPCRQHRIGVCVICEVPEQKPRARHGEEAQRLLAILETIPDAIIATDNSGNIETFNLASEPLFQFTAEEVIGQNIELLLPTLLGPDDYGTSRPRGLPTGGPGRELTARRKDGSSFPVELAVGEMNLSGKRLLVFSLKDITVRVRAQKAAKEAQDQLIQAEKLASLGGLVAGVAHEINTPVGIAVTAASHLRDKYQDLYAEYQNGTLKRSALEEFLDTCNHATRILDTNLRRASELIHSFKQIAVDRSAGQARSFDVRNYLEELLVSLRPALKKARHQVHLSCPPDLKIFADPGSLSQVLTNLIVNSLAHAYEPGQAGHLRIAIEPDEAGIRLVYSDDGKGIPKDDLPHIFDPFFTTRRGDGGSGLGLHIVYNAVKKNLAGSIRCASEPGEGTSFEIRIPCPREPA